MSTATERLNRPVKPRGAVLTPAPASPAPTVSPHEIAARSAAKAQEASRRRAADEARWRRNRRLAIWGLIIGACMLLALPLGLWLRHVIPVQP